MTVAALIYAGLCTVTMVFHLAVILGAPFGAYTQGGRHSGRLPPAGRLAAAFSVLLLGVMAHVVLTEAGLLKPVAAESHGWAIWVVVAMTLIAVVLNLMTPSRPERMVWGPVTLVMAACVLWVALG